MGKEAAKMWTKTMEIAERFHIIIDHWSFEDLEFNLLRRARPYFKKIEEKMDQIKHIKEDFERGQKRYRLNAEYKKLLSKNIKKEKKKERGKNKENDTETEAELESDVEMEMAEGKITF